MNDSNFIAEIGIGATLAALLILMAYPFKNWMPDMFTMLVLGMAIVLFAVFAVFVWRESAQDEREQLHKMVASRIGFLVGSSVLLLGIVVEMFGRHEVNTWLLLALAGMVGGKILGLMWSRNRY
jgi:peptidoglycan/LPS O-acetylase OafA/YrhL